MPLHRSPYRNMNSGIPPLLLFLLLIAAACREPADDYLIKVYKGESDEPGVESGYVNQAGDTVIPLGKYQYCYTDTLRTFAVVQAQNGELIGIDRHGERLFGVYAFDNGPDYPSEGLFRITEGSLIGYADAAGNVVIPPRYACAFPFEGGKAKVALQCSTVTGGEHASWESQEWHYIDKKGKATAK